MLCIQQWNALLFPQSDTPDSNMRPRTGNGTHDRILPSTIKIPAGLLMLFIIIIQNNLPILNLTYIIPSCF